MSAEIMDKMARENFPVLAALHARQSTEPEPVRFGQRFVLGRSALHREVRLPWLHCSLPIATIQGLPTPFGDLEPVVEFSFNPPPAGLWKQFREQAALASPLECAGLLIWNAATGVWRFAMREATEASMCHINYTEPPLGDDEIAVIDLHSHGQLDAFFSARDNRDDTGAIKIAAVIGNVDTNEPTIAVRLVCIDRFVPLELIQDGDAPRIEVKPGATG